MVWHGNRSLFSDSGGSHFWYYDTTVSSSKWLLASILALCYWANQTALAMGKPELNELSQKTSLQIAIFALDISLISIYKAACLEKIQQPSIPRG